METITMYELLGLVKDGKAPKKVKYINSIWEYDKGTKDYFHDDLWLIYSMNSIGLTEREVEILEEEKKIPEKLETYKDRNNEIFLDDLCYKCMPIHKDSLSFNERVIVDKLNEVIDYLKSKGDE